MTSTGPTAGAARPTEQMWREVVAQLRAFVRRRIADPERADDLVGEILLRIHQNLHSVDDRERLLNWVFRVARNAVVDEYRRAGRAREQLVPTLVDAPVADPVPGDEDPSGVLDEL
ncbi:MAG TPA: sigma factor, partial [Pseudonocardia sp.]|nr:sigma factor [Pseudonocardia sp.]